MIANHTQRIVECKPLSLKSALDNPPMTSQPVQPFHSRINSRRLEKGLTVEQVYDLILRYRWQPGVRPPALPSVGHWFNGTRRPRNMDHMRALCNALDMSLDEAMGQSPKEAQTDMEQRMLSILRDLDPAQAEALLMTGEVMRTHRAPRK